MSQEPSNGAGDHFDFSAVIEGTDNFMWQEHMVLDEALSSAMGILIHLG